MYTLKLNREARTLVEVPLAEYGADPACIYFHAEGKCVIVPTLVDGVWSEIVWQHRDWKPPVVTLSGNEKTAKQLRSSPPPTELPCIMEGVSEYGDELDVELAISTGVYRPNTPRPECPGYGRLVTRAFNEGGYSSTDVDLLQLIAWLKTHHSDLLA